MAEEPKTFRFSKVIQKHKLPAILLAALLTLAALTVLVRLAWAWFAGAEYPSVTVTEQNGVYDLTGITDLDKTVIRLFPGKSYYPGVYLTPENVDTAVPESIDRYAELRTDCLSQSFVLRLPDNSTVYNLTFTLSGRHAMCVYVNGSLTAKTGEPGTTKQTTEVWENNISFNTSAVNGKMEIILHSAQFYHAKRGASLAGLSLSNGRTLKMYI